ncbi:MAG: DUF4342 domain-containing protein [Sarcina sp.]
MEHITLEKVDLVIERTAATYKEAKEALEKAEGNVLEAIILIEDNQRAEMESYEREKESCKNSKECETAEDMKKWITDLVKKGNVSRVKIKKDGKVLTDIPVNAGIAAGAIAILLPPVFAVAVVATVATNLEIEITKADGSVEVVNKIIKNAASNLKEKTMNVVTDVSEKVKEKSENKTASIIKDSILKNIKKPSIKREQKEFKDHEISNFSYTVNFEEID